MRFVDRITHQTWIVVGPEVTRAEGLERMREHDALGRTAAVDRRRGRLGPEWQRHLLGRHGTSSCFAHDRRTRRGPAAEHEAVIDRVYRNSKERQLRVLPLVLNLSRPTPSLGWRYSENPSFLDRAIGRFDLVMMLAVVHHMLVQERIPLREIFRLAADLTTDALIVEFVPPNDPMFRSLARGRDHLHADLTKESFMNAASEFFKIIKSNQLDQSERTAFLMRKK